MSVRTLLQTSAEVFLVSSAGAAFDESSVATDVADAVQNAMGRVLEKARADAEPVHALHASRQEQHARSFDAHGVH